MCGLMTAKDAMLAVAVSSSAAAIGSISAMAAVVIATTIVLKGHTSYAYRITLYLAILNLLDRIMIGLELLPVNFHGLGNSSSTVTLRNQSGWGKACTAIGFLSQYLGLSKSLVLLWLCLYVFALATFQAQVRNEVVGLLSVLLIPLVIVWIPFLGDAYGLMGTWCWIKDHCNGTHVQDSWYRLAVSDIPDLLLHVMSSILIAIVIIIFCKRSLIASPLQRCQQTALKKILPLLLYPALHSVVEAGNTAKDVYFSIIKLHNGRAPFIVEMVVVVLIQTFTIALPISLLVNSEVRSTLFCIKQKVKTIQPHESSVYQTNDGPSAYLTIGHDRLHETSATVFNVSLETSESEPLIIRTS